MWDKAECLFLWLKNNAWHIAFIVGPPICGCLLINQPNNRPHGISTYALLGGILILLWLLMVVCALAEEGAEMIVVFSKIVRLKIISAARKLWMWIL